MNYRITKAGVAICPFFIWQSEDVEKIGHNENDVNLTFCSHPDNKNKFEGNCREEYCPINKKTGVK